jgi:quercetin 2,3-dioxygenase
MANDRAVRVVRTVRTDEGIEEIARRCFPQEMVPHVEPLLLLDETGPELSAGNARAAGWIEHPHYGFVALTYVVGGIPWEGIDMQGIYNRQDVGSISWLSTGGGAVHIERPMEPVLSEGGWAHAVQVWLKLPNDEMGDKPVHIYVPPTELPRVELDDGQALVRVLAGSAHGVEAPVHATTPLLYLHYSLSAGAKVTVDLAPGWVSVVYPMSGTVTVGATEIEPNYFGVLYPGPGGVTLSAHENDVEVLVLAAPPQGEQFVRMGPFAAPDERTIGSCFERWFSGQMGQVDEKLAVAKPWTGELVKG